MNTITEDMGILKDEIVLKKTNEVRVSGFATCTYWDQSPMELEMRDYYVEVEPGMTDEELKRLVFENANDSEFGVYSIDSILVSLHALYRSENGDTAERLIAQDLEIKG